ncbi:hypothetical protein AUQ48_16265 [Kocuria flava]|uniref:Uncharacterized protein n=1 Tax=Kocuria flava TaxID=446860 RepID=A0A2N4SY18_9MICC|nr:hypothetical protein [Kocuria flava]PLC10873.1 hypothetical protein AUQ48_16265 [Kocuria flava]
MSRSTSRSRAFFGGVPWWVIVGVPVAMIVARFVLEGLGVPTAPAVLGLFTALFTGFSVAVVRRRGWSVAWRTSVLPGAGGLLGGAAVMGAGLTTSGVQQPWGDATYPPGVLVMVLVLLGLQLLLTRDLRVGDGSGAGRS